MKFGLLAVIAVQIFVNAGTAYAGVAPVPVPEPMSLALLGVGAAIVATGAWWRNRK